MVFPAPLVVKEPPVRSEGMAFLVVVVVVPQLVAVQRKWPRMCPHVKRHEANDGVLMK